MVETFGLLSICFMVLFYTFEAKARAYTLAFAGACLSASLYAFLIGSYPFMIAEFVWSMVALRKWVHRAEVEA
ncbi:MAG: hypothetical protein AAGB04_29835 [Pseudomonadota bacterium]